MRILSMIAAALLCMAPLATTQAAAADITGSYLVDGTSPGGGSYTGSVSVKKNADSLYQVVWTIGGEKYIGTAIGTDEMLSISYRSGNNTGVGLYVTQKNGSVKGIWTYAGGKELGGEVWLKK